MGVTSAVVFAALAGCSPPFPRDLLDRVDGNASFAAIRKEPAQYAGKLVMLGGTIVDAVQLKEGTRLEVLQRPLDGGGRPLLTDETGGRFLVLTRQFLDSAVYHRGRTVTVIGAVEAPQMLPLGEIEAGSYFFELWIRRDPAREHRPAHALVIEAR